MATRHRKTRRRLRSKRTHSRKGSRRQRGGRGSTLGDLVAVLHEYGYNVMPDMRHGLHEILGVNAFIWTGNNGESIDTAEINEALELSDDTLRTLLENAFGDEEFVEEFFSEIKEIVRMRNAIEAKKIREKGRNTIALQYVAKAPQNGSRAANVLLHPQLSGVIGEQLSGKKGSIPSQVNKLKQNIGIPGAPHP
jgi:hypothetical protein